MFFLNICVSPDVWLNHVRDLTVNDLVLNLCIRVSPFKDDPLRLFLLSIIDLGTLQYLLCRYSINKFEVLACIHIYMCVCI